MLLEDGWTLVSVHETPLERFGQEVRHISVSEFDREATAARCDPTHTAEVGAMATRAHAIRCSCCPQSRR